MKQTTLDFRRSLWATDPVLPEQKNDRVKRLQIILRLHGVTCHSTIVVNLLNSTQGLPRGSPTKRDALFPEPLVYSLIHSFIHPFIHTSPSPQLSSCPCRENSHRPRSPTWTEDLQKMRFGLVPQGDRLRHCYYYPSAMHPSA